MIKTIEKKTLIPNKILSKMKKNDENIAIEEVKSRLRNEALEKEVIRLKNRSSKQKKFNKVVFFFCLQARILITCFFVFKKESIENTFFSKQYLN